ncbi:MAG: VOC family protein [Pseudomonadota bacterium]
MSNPPYAEVFPLLWSPDVGAIADWAVHTLGLSESWRAPGETGEIEHAELHWFSGKVSVNIDRGDNTGPSGISLRVDSTAVVDQIFERAQAAGGTISQGSQGPEHSRIAYSFTAIDPDGNQWWVNAETGFLDELRQTQA